MLFASTSFLSTQGDIRRARFDRRLVLRDRRRLLRTSCRTGRPWFSDRPGRLLKKGPESGKAGEAGTAAVPAFGEVQRPRTQSARAEAYVTRDSPAPAGSQTCRQSPVEFLLQFGKPLFALFALLRSAKHLTVSDGRQTCASSAEPRQRERGQAPPQAAFFYWNSFAQVSGPARPSTASPHS